MLGDQRRVERLAVVGGSLTHDAAGAHDRDLSLAELVEQPVLALGDLLGELLDRVDRSGHPNEADDVARDAARQRDQAVRRPLVERGRPWQRQELGGVGCGGEEQAHASTLTRPA